MKRWGILYLVPAGAYMALIFWLSSRPAPEFAHYCPIVLGFKLLHMAEFGVLSLLFAEGLRRGSRLPVRTIVVTSVLLTFLWGVADEWHQVFVPQRTPSPVDAVSDLIGAALLMAAYCLFRRCR